MSRRVSIAEAKDGLSAVVRDVEHGEAVEITRRGLPVAVVIAYEEYQRLKRERPDPWAILSAFREAHDLERLDIAGALDDVRDPDSGPDFSW